LPNGIGVFISAISSCCAPSAKSIFISYHFHF
jgi:hypothetical protein